MRTVTFKGDDDDKITTSTNRSGVDRWLRISLTRWLVPEFLFNVFDTAACRDRTRPCVKDIRTKMIARAIVDAQNNGEPTFLRCLSCEIGEGNETLRKSSKSFFLFSLRLRAYRFLQYSTEYNFYNMNYNRIIIVRSSFGRELITQQNYCALIH